MEPADRTGQSESSELASQGLSIIVAKVGGHATRAVNPLPTDRRQALGEQHH